jgi:hypothetical protein
MISVTLEGHGGKHAGSDAMPSGHAAAKATEVDASAGSALRYNVLLRQRPFDISSGTIDLLAPLGESIQLPELRILEAEPFYELVETQRAGPFVDAPARGQPAQGVLLV